MITVRTVTGETFHAANQGGPLGFGSLCRRVHPARGQHVVTEGLRKGHHVPEVTCKVCIRALAAELSAAWTESLFIRDQIATGSAGTVTVVQDPTAPNEVEQYLSNLTRVTDPAAAELLAHDMVTVLRALAGRPDESFYRTAITDPGNPLRPALDALEGSGLVHAWNDGTGYAITPAGAAAVAPTPAQSDRPAGVYGVALTPEDAQVLRRVRRGHAVYAAEINDLVTRGLVRVVLDAPILTDLGRLSLWVHDTPQGTPGATLPPGGWSLRTDDAVLDALGGRDGAGASAAAALGDLEALLLKWRRAIDAAPVPANPYPVPEHARKVKTFEQFPQGSSNEFGTLGHLWKNDAGDWAAVDSRGVLVAHEVDERTARRALHLGAAAALAASPRDEAHPDSAAPAGPPCTGQAFVSPVGSVEFRAFRAECPECVDWTPAYRPAADAAQADANLHNAAARPVDGPYTRGQMVAIGGHRWNAGEAGPRVYLNDWAPWVPFDVEYYGTGNVRSASLFGETISDARAGRILGGKVFWRDGRIHSSVGAAVTWAGFDGTTADRRILDEIARLVALLADQD